MLHPWSDGKCKISTHTPPTRNCQVTLVTQAHTNLQLMKSSGLPRLKTSTIEILRCTHKLEVGITKFLYMSVHEPTTSQETLILHSFRKPVPRKLFAPPLNSWNQSGEINMEGCWHASNKFPAYCGKEIIHQHESKHNTLMTTPIFGKKNSDSTPWGTVFATHVKQEEAAASGKWHSPQHISTAGCGCTNGTNISDQ